MSEARKTAVWTVWSLLLCAAAGSVVADTANPYQGIVERNVFGLKPPSPPPKTEPDKPPAPDITISGITTIFGNKRAILSAKMPARPPEPAKPQSFILAEGQRDGELEVLEIDPTLDGGTVKVKNFGQVMTLSMNKNGAKLPTGAPPAPIPGVPNQLAYAQPGVPGGGDSGLKPIPIRQLRMPGAENPAASPSSANQAPAPTFAQTQQQPGQARLLNAEEQAMHMLAQHVQMTDQGHEMPPLPPPLAEALQEPAQPQSQPVVPGLKNPSSSFPPRSPLLPPTLPPSLPP